MIAVSYFVALTGIAAWLLITIALAALSFRFAWAGWTFLAVLLAGIAFAIGFAVRGAIVWPPA